jgi:hypothetical protein
MLLTVSIVVNILLWRAGERQLAINEIYEEWISDWRRQVLKTWTHIKLLDDKQLFEKDDEVGIVFRDMVELIKSLSDKTEE